MALRFQLLVVLAVLSLVVVQIDASVLGIDFGAEFVKVALVQPGAPFEIVNNLQSKRKTRTCLFFKSSGEHLERQFGDDAYQYLGKKPESTFCKFNRMIGKKHDSESKSDVYERIKNDYFFPYQYGNSSETGRTTLYLNEKMSLEPEEMVAMLLEHIKLYSTNYGGKNIKDVVFTVPSYYTQREKTALIAAAEIADLRVLSLIEENTAAALHYSIDRAHTLEAPQNVMFYNLGANSLQVTIANFSSSTVQEGGKDKKIGAFEVIGKAWDENLGGFDFDISLTNWLSEKFNEGWRNKKKHSKDVRTEAKNQRAMARLKLEANKLKETLSANDNFPSKVDQLYDDMDVSTKISRQEFEEYVKDALLARLFGPIDKALAMANIDKSSIAAIELLGGGIRVPKVKEMLNSYFLDANKTCSQHINGDESMALGAAFRGAQLQTSFAVKGLRKIESKDFSPFTVSLSLKAADAEVPNSDNWSKESKLYQSGIKSSFYGKKMTVSMPFTKDMSVTLFYNQSDPANAKLPDGTHDVIGAYTLSGIAAFTSDLNEKTKEFAFLEKGLYNVTDPKITLGFLLDPNTGVYSIYKAEVFVEATEIVEEKPVEGEASGDVAAAAGETADTDGASIKTDAEDGTSNSIKPETAKETSDKADAKTPPRKLPLKKTRSLTISEVRSAMEPAPWTPEQIAAKRVLIDSLDAADETLRKKDAAMNDLETFGYATKNRLEDDSSLSKVSTLEQREELREAVQAELDWLEETGSSAETQVYKDRLSGVSKKANVIYRRLSELVDRPKEVEKAKAKLDRIKTTVTESWAETMPQITEEEKTNLLELVGKAESWLDEKVEIQSQRAAHDDPAFFSTDIKPILKDVSLRFEKLSKKKPLPPPVINNSTNSSGSSNSSDTNSTEKVNINPDSSSETPSEEDAKGEDGNSEGDSSNSGSGNNGRSSSAEGAEGEL